MKKLFVIVCSILISVCVFAQTKRVEQFKTQKSFEEEGNFRNTETKLTKSLEWAKVKDFTATDIKGISHHLQSYLNAGKTVIVDLSAAWCSYCWQYHQKGVLKELYNNYGPSGTISQDMVILFVEIESANTLAQIQGTTMSQTYAGLSQGDFTEGGTWPIPIIDNTSVANSFSALYQGAIPAVFMVCPTGYYKQISTGLTAAQIYAGINDGPSESAVPMVNIIAPSGGEISTEFNFSAEVVSVVDVTYKWTLNGGTPATATTETVNVTYATPGTYTITLAVTNVNGTTIVNKTIVVANCNDVQTLPFTESFDNGGLPPCWTVNDADGDGYNWDAESVVGLFGSHAGDGLISSASYLNNVGALTPDNWLISPKIQLQNNNTFTFWMSSQDASYFAEKYGVYVSTTGTATADFTEIFSETMTATGGSTGNAKAATLWVQKTVDLSAYAGKEVYIAWRHYGCTDAFWLNLDDVSITSTATSMNDIAAPKILLYPNPAKNEITIAGIEGQDIVIMNTLGQTLMTINNAAFNQRIDLSDYINGTYLVKINQNVFKFNVVK